VYTFESAPVKALEFSLVSGHVKVRTSKHVNNVEVHLTKGAHSDELLNYIVHTSTFENGKFTLRVDSPSFDWNHCQIATVEVIVPEAMTVTSPMDFSASVVVGKIDLVLSEDYPLGVVALHTELGIINGHDFHAREAIVVTAGVGALHLKNFHSPQVSATVDFGYIRARNVEAVQALVEVKTGVARLNHWSSLEFTLNSNIGWVHLGDFYHTKKVVATVNYGKLRFVPETWQGAFTLESPYGFISFDQHSSIPEPTYDERGLAKIAGHLVFEPLETQADPTKFEDTLSLTSVYGAVSVFVPAIPSEKFYEKHGHYKYPGK
jgi:hypothetical protein